MTTRRRVGETKVAMLLGSKLGVVLTVALVGSLAGSSPAADEPGSVTWNPDWPRFRTSEAVVTGAMLLPIAGAVFVYPHPDDNWHGGILFDDAIRDALVLGSRDGRDQSARYSDFIYHVLGLYPLLIDNALVTWGIHGAGDVALEMLGMNLEAYAITGAIVLTGESLGRVRPMEHGCNADPNYASKCGNPTALNKSFLSGHTAIAFTSAGLMCAHHQHLPLYGGGAGDLAACWVALAGSAAASVMRITSDNHYATDVLLGAGIGLASGYVLPSWLHYGFGKGGDTGSVLPSLRGGEGSMLRALLAPRIGEGFLGAQLVGIY
jgi:membrane-associated phospholipid phosphatase